MTWVGINKASGREVTDLDHIRQSVADILTTPVGTRIMRRDYGCLVFELIDQPYSGALRLKIMAACVMALLRWEPRVIIERMELSHSHGAAFYLDLAGRTTSGAAFEFGVPIT